MSKFRKKPVVIDAIQWFPGVHHPAVQPPDIFEQTYEAVG